VILDRSARRPRAVLLALFLGAFGALAVPAWASAAEFTVTGAGDTGTRTACETKVGECTLRGAIEATDAAAPGPNGIKFDPTFFDGQPGDTIAPGATLLPAISVPTTIDGAGCNAGTTVTCLSGASLTSSPLLEFKADGTKLENLSIVIPAGRVGIRLTGGHTVEVLDNTIDLPGTSSPSTGIESSFGASGGLIEGNKITSAFGFNYSVALRGGSNRILGNELIGAGCCQAGITIELGSAGNQIGGDSPESENVFEGFGSGAVSMLSSPGFDSTHNEVRRNRGSNGLNFINGAGVAAPAITEALTSSVSGTAEPGATVRVFPKATEEPGEIESFLGETEADIVTGTWKVSFAKVPIGTFAAATQTLAGSTSSLGGSATTGKSPAEEQEEKEGAEKAAKEKEAAERAARERQEKEAREQREKEAKEKEGGSGGGGSTGGGSTGGSSSQTPAPSPPPPPTVARVAPKVKITAGPKRISSATTARFRLKAEPAAGAKFECKLDGAKWAKCSSPRTYKHPKPGKHAFRVRATAGGLTGAVTKYQFTVKT
jgi:hypothetical protein